MFKLRGSRFSFLGLNYPEINVEFPDDVKVIGVFGANGSGKTTFFRMLSSLTGKMRKIDLLEGESALDQIELIPQNFSISNSFILTEQFIQDVFDIHNIDTKFVDFTPIQEHLTKKLIHLSGGEIKKLLFWMSLQKCSQVLLLDEILANLDPKNKKQFIEIIQEKKENYRLIFFSSHDKKVLESLCDWFIGLNEFKITFSGNKELFLKENAFEVFHEI